MATHFTRTWTGADTTDWALDSSGTWKRIHGASIAATIQSNKGTCGAAAAERAYRVTSFPGDTNYKWDVDTTFKDPDNAADQFAMLLRADEGFTKCYAIEIDSNNGTARARIRRRRASAWTDIVSWTNLAVDLVALVSVNFEARIENLTSGKVNIKLFANGSEELTFDDTNAARVESGGTIGILLGANPVADDITWDNLRCRDFEDEATATAAELDERVAISVDGTHYSWEELKDAKVFVGRGRDTYGVETLWELSDALAFEEEGVLYPGAQVTIYLKGNVVARGKIRTASTSARPGEGHTFRLEGPKRLAQDVLIRHPVTKAPTIGYNVQKGKEHYDSTRVNQTHGDVIEDILSNHADGDGYLRSQGAYPMTGDGWVSAETSAMTTKMPGLLVSGDVVRAIEMILSFTDRVLRIAPGDYTWNFFQRNSGTQTSVDIDADHVEAQLDVNLDRNKTAIECRGSTPKTTLTTLSTKDSTLNVGWDANIANKHTAERGHKGKLVGIVGSAVVSPPSMNPNPTGPPAFSMEANEVVRNRLVFKTGAEAGNSYTIETNTGSSITIEEDAWEAGGPSAGDGFEILGDLENGGRDNGFKQVGRRFVPSNSDLKFAEDSTCPPKVTIEFGDMKMTTSIKLEDKQSGVAHGVNLDMPAIGLINSLQPNNAPDSCAEGGIGEIADVTIEAPMYNESTEGDVPILRRPTEGFYGTSFTKESSKWSGGGEPGKGDPGVMAVYPMNIPEFTGSTSDVTEFTKMLDDVLKVLSPIAREAQVTIKGKLDESWAGLNKRLKLVSAKRTIPDALWSDLDLLAVEWDPETNTTTLFAGTQSSGQYDIEGMRREFIAAHRRGRSEDNRKLIEDLLACVSQGTGGDTGTPDPAYVPDCQVVTRDPQGNPRPLSEQRFNEISCEYTQAPDVTSACVAECDAGPRPVVDKARLLANAQDFKGLKGVIDWYPQKEVEASDPTMALPSEILCCIVTHIEQLWNWQYQLAAALNANHRQNHDDFTTIAGFIQTLATNDTNLKNCINALNGCMQNKQDAPAGTQSPCWSTDPCPITTSFTYTGPCEDYCAETPPQVDCYAGE